MVVSKIFYFDPYLGKIPMGLKPPTRRTLKSMGKNVRPIVCRSIQLGPQGFQKEEFIYAYIATSPLKMVPFQGNLRSSSGGYLWRMFHHEPKTQPQNTQKSKKSSCKKIVTISACKKRENSCILNLESP